VVPWNDGFLAAGRGFCWAFTARGWQDFHLDDEIYSGATLNSEAFLSGRKGVYRIPKDGPLERIQQNASDKGVYLHTIRNRLYVFAVERGTFVWTGSKLVAADDMEWAKDAAVISVQELDQGRLFAATTNGLFLLNKENIMAICPKKFPNILSHSLVNSSLFGEHLVAAMYYGGIASLSVTEDKLDWRLTPDDLGGNVYFSREYRGGLLIGHSNGIALLHDPERFSTSALPAGDFLFTAGLSDGVKIGLTTGIAMESGKPTLYRDLQRADIVYGMVEANNGHVVIGYDGKIEVEGKMITLGGREVSAIAILPDGKMAVMQPQGISLLAEDGAPKLLPIESTVNSLVASPTSEFLVGTANGVTRFSSNGEPRGNFGHGITKVFSTGGKVVAIDDAGEILSGDGTLLGSMPPGEAIGAAEWHGLLHVLARLDDGSSWLGRVEDKSWKPLDVPLPESPRALAVEGDHLLVVAPEILFTIKAADLLPNPSIEVALARSDGRGFKSQEILPASENNIGIYLPPHRLGGWKNPQYQIRVAEGPWESVTTGRLEIPRLAWGSNPIEIRASWAGLQAERSIIVRRAYPWYLRLPMMVVYGLAFVGLFFGAVAWRTRNARVREKQLQALVEVRTSDLVKANQTKENLVVELRKANHAKEEFLSAMSHEIRNPLNGVVGLCNMLVKAPADPTDDRTVVTSLQDCAEHLQTLLGDVLDFAKIDRGEIQIEVNDFDPCTAVTGAVHNADPGSSSCMVDVSGVTGWLRSDVGKIRQVIINLVKNALKYGEPPTAEIKAFTVALPNGKTQFTVSVRNEGKTIPPEELTHLFDSFTRGSDAIARGIPGSGVGLSVSRRLAEAMGGTLTATSANEITEFTLSLELEPGSKPNFPKADTEKPLKNVRVLVVEDEYYNRVVFEDMLQDMGCIVDLAETGEVALEYVRANHYEIIFSDFRLPDMDGTELVKRMVPVLTNKPPIIAVTAYSTPEKIAAAKEAGVTGYLVKPFSKAKLIAAITSVSATWDFKPEPTLPVSPNGIYDFTDLLNLRDGKQKLAQYGVDLQAAWKAIAAQLRSKKEMGPPLAREIHAFRSLLLAGRAVEAAEQAAMLENMAQTNDRQCVPPVNAAVEDFVKRISEAAQALSCQDSDGTPPVKTP